MFVPLQSAIVSPPASSPLIEKQKDHREEAKVMIAPKQLQAMTRDIKEDIEQQDQ